MKPDRSNYEILLIDWLDGKLDKAQVELLLSFLNENPDLKDEADSLSLFYLSPVKDSSGRKNIPEKTPSDLPISQIEYLSVAFLEKDISAGQLDELKENISENPDNKFLFETIQKIKLMPQQDNFINKKSLKRLNTGEKLMRLSVMGLSAAATIAILVLSYIFGHDYLSGKNSAVVQITIPDTGSIQPFIASTRTFKTPLEEPVLSIEGNISTAVSTKIRQSVRMNDDSTVVAASDTYEKIISAPIVKIAIIPVLSVPWLNIVTPGQKLIASNNDIIEPVPEDGQNRLSKFISKTFREKILREPNSGDEPLKAYELAEAGVGGLNKLLGWDMALVATNNQDGYLKSVYFSSRILKFNAPVKKDVAEQ